MGPGLQEWIHKLEEGEGTKYLRVVFVVLALLGVAAMWHIREARGYSAVEAMDQGQLAHNLAEKKGYTTYFVRPISMAMIESVRGPGNLGLKEPHPDLANPPVYPVMLAGLMKVLPFNWKINENGFQRFQPEVLVGLFNNLIFFASVFLVFRVARQLFDPAVAWVSTLLFALTEVYWEFTTSGLSTNLLVFLFLVLAWLLIRLEAAGRNPEARRGGVILTGAAIGLVLAVMCLTRYSMGWLVIPAALFVAGFCGPNRFAALPAVLLVFLLCLAPWLYRNYSKSGALFGTAGLAVKEGTGVYPNFRLERMMPKNLQLELNRVDAGEYMRKLVSNLHGITSQDLPLSGGNWVLGLFLAGLLVPFMNPGLARLRYFLLAAIACLAVAQALGRTHLSEMSPRINSENLLVIVMPVVFMFGVAFFLTLLDQASNQAQWLRKWVISAFILVMSLPLILRFLPPRDFPVVYPPYYPPVTQQVSEWLEPRELMMSDMPWAVAWYGNHEAVWTTMDAGAKPTDDFYRINDFERPIKAIYLTPMTTDLKFLSDVRQSPDGIWGKFYLDVVVLKNLPYGFPLKVAPPGLLPDQLFLSDRVRWSE